MLPVTHFLLDLSWIRTLHNTEPDLDFPQGPFRSNGNLKSVTTLHNSHAEMVQDISQVFPSLHLALSDYPKRNSQPPPWPWEMKRNFDLE